MAKYIFVIDLDRCIGCQGCILSCKLENDIELGVYRNSVCVVGPTGEYPHMEMYFLPFMCQQCESPECVTVCPVGACTTDSETGIVNIDREECVACGRCVGGCPYGAITIDRKQQLADKCNACAKTRKKGEDPACVKNCAASALHFGDVEDPESEVSVLLKKTEEEHIHTLRDYGTGPANRYILRKCEWKDVRLSDCKGWGGKPNMPD